MRFLEASIYVVAVIATLYILISGPRPLTADKVSAVYTDNAPYALMYEIRFRHLDAPDTETRLALPWVAEHRGAVRALLQELNYLAHIGDMFGHCFTTAYVADWTQLWTPGVCDRETTTTTTLRPVVHVMDDELVARSNAQLRVALRRRPTIVERGDS